MRPPSLGAVYRKVTHEERRDRQTVPVGRANVRILANVADLSPNTGISVQTLQTTEALAGRGHRLDLVYIQDGPYRPRYAEFCDSMEQVPALDLGAHHFLRDAPRLWPAFRAGVRAHPDVIYLNRFRPLPWALGTAAVARAPVVCHLHGFIGIEKPMVNRALGRLTARFICVSQFVRDGFVAMGGDPDRTDVVHNGIDVDEYPVGGHEERRAARAELGLSDEPFIVMYFGRVVPEKGVDVLVEAVAQLARDLSSGAGAGAVELLMVGPQPDEAYAKRTFDAAPGVRIHQLPMRNDVVTPLHAADVVVVPSVWEEPFGRTVIEALSTGRPVIASAIGGIPEILTGGFARFLVPPGDAAALATKLGEVLDWRAREPELAEACTEHVARNFSLAPMVDAIEARLVDAGR
jgi:glycosyltransferase involved in cell wall biosynthesis